MTRLFIEGKEVALPSDLVLDFYSQNPFFTKNGDYTFDMDIDLAHPNNRLIYQSINRLDVTKRPTNRSAVLMCGPMEIIRGTEVILSIEENVAKIQIVGGNSELNYLSGGEQTLWNDRLAYEKFPLQSTRKTEKLILADKSRSKKFAVSAKTPLKKLLLSATLEWNRIREFAKPLNK